ncbi:MAG: DUF4258 domain-containing protein [Candidatus Margulisbacteria bacterium]|nr:DUF4258 domain-containing protein [Candidatus Margulisiibacteriota bacterium]MBU1617471.1 DUF4258 domain-containing protein [Candidatus Margulisiibacteriota bacterium]MBU1867802.1 DUF4258 domain-containing protein [Candidatus Margulisiibacteriota bacterium]
MKVYLCDHSKQRIKERLISIKDLTIALQNVTMKVPAKKKGRYKICGSVNARLLWVIYEIKKNSTYFIITAYWA